MYWNFKGASAMLRARLANTNRVNVIVVDYPAFEGAKQLDDIEGSIFCTFASTVNSNPVLLVFGRSRNQDRITHIFAFYVNSRFRIIQPIDRKKFATKLPAGTRLGLDVKLGILNIVVDAPRACYLTILIQVAEFYLNSSLMDSFSAEVQISRSKLVSPVSFNKMLGCPPCVLGSLDGQTLRIISQAQSIGYELFDIDMKQPPARVPQTANILRIRYLGHMFYGTYHSSHKTLLITIPHSGLFVCESDAAKLATSARSWYPEHCVREFGWTRYYGRADEHCDSVDTYRAVLIAGGWPVHIIKKCDLDVLCPLTSSKSKPISQAVSDYNVPSAAEPDNVLPADEKCEFLHDLGLSQSDVSRFEMEMDEEHCEPLSYSPISSQATEIYDVGMDLMDKVTAIAHHSDLRHPVVHDIGPMNDHNNSILNDRHFFLREMDNIFRGFDIPVRRLGCATKDTAEEVLAQAFLTLEQTMQLIILPIELDDLTIVVIFDLYNYKIGVFVPDYDENREGDIFLEVRRVLLANHLLDDPIQIAQIAMQLHFHKELRNMHLLISLYCFAEAFKLVGSIPYRVTYTEKRFRSYCFSICRQLQVQNAEYNAQSGLVKENGFLRPGAYRSLPSLVFFERSTVSTNLCLYCAARPRARDLKSHMLMKHANQALVKRRRRDELAQEQGED